jgi:hypothetical protein
MEEVISPIMEALLLNAYCVLNIRHIIFTIASHNALLRSYFHLHFADEETKA